MIFSIQIIDWLHELSKKLTRSPSGSSPVLNFTNSPIQIGIILRHNDYFYTATLGCQSHFVSSKPKVLKSVQEIKGRVPRVRRSGPTSIKCCETNSNKF